MTRSMTAFTRQETRQTFGTLSWEIRSVNQRYLEPHLRLPDTLRDLEGPLRDKLRQSLNRGKVECTLRFVPADDEGTLQVDTARVEELLGAMAQVQALLPSAKAPTATDILGWPGVLKTLQPDMDAIKAAALELFDIALNDLITGREREGQALEQLIDQRLESISAVVAEVRQQMPQILAAQKAQLKQKIEEVGVAADPQRLEQEIVLLAQRADVDEEMDRLDTHVTEVRRVLKREGPIGRRLDFLMQELNREANTLSSKSIVASTTQSAVELKVLIEQMREQIQNIE